MTEETTAPVVPETTEPDFEAKASELGWTPKEKFRGDPEKWRDAKTFYEKGEMVLPLVKKQRDEFKARLDKTEKEFSELRGTVQEVIKFNEAAAERKYKAEITALREAKAAAVESGDRIAYQRADEALEAAKEEKPKAVEAKVETKTGDPEFEAWVAENQWYATDAKKRMLANSVGIDLVTDNPNLRGRALFDEVNKELKRIEEEKSGTERAGPQRGGKGSGPISKAKTFDNLLPEYKQAFARFERNGMKMTKEAYVSKCDPDAWGS